MATPSTAIGLRRTTREKLALGGLPTAAPQRLAVVAGRGAACALCGQPISAPDLEYELHFAGGIVPRRFHSTCHTIWDTERRK